MGSEDGRKRRKEDQWGTEDDHMVFVAYDQRSACERGLSYDKGGVKKLEEADEQKHLPLEIPPYIISPLSHPCSRPRCPSSSLMTLTRSTSGRGRKGSGRNRGACAQTENSPVLLMIVPLLID